MSGGSYNYIYSRLLDECSGQMFDSQMEEMLEDFAKVLHDLEWWCSLDISEETYRQTVKEFKEKWFDGKIKDTKLYKKGYRDAIQDCYETMQEKLKEWSD